MDDLTRSTDPTGERWDHDRFITFASITGAQLNGEMSEDDYARFGRFVFGSLSALAKFRPPEEFLETLESLDRHPTRRSRLRPGV